MKKNKNRLIMKKLALITILLVLVGVKTVYGLGIATDYGSEKIGLLVGTNHVEYSFRLQNMGEDEVDVEIHVTSDNNTAKLRDEKPVYTIPPKTTDNEFIIDLDLPEDAKAGDAFDITYTVNVVPKAEGQVSIGQAIQKSFEVRIVEKPAKNIIDYWVRRITGFLTMSSTKGKEVYLLVITGIVCLGLIVWLFKFKSGVDTERMKELDRVKTFMYLGTESNRNFMKFLVDEK